MAVVGLALVVGIVAALLGCLFTDPFGLSPSAGLPFDPVAVPLPEQEFPPPMDLKNRLLNAKRLYEGEAFGPESMAWDADGRGPYVGVSDGRVLRRAADGSGWETFAWASSLRTAEACDARVGVREGASPMVFGVNMSVAPNLPLEHICGRPLGLRFHPGTGRLLFADAYFGLFEAGPLGGKARLLVDEVEGRKMMFVNDLDIDADEDDAHGTVYFTDTSTRFHRRNFFSAIMEAHADGRLLKLDLATGAVTVLVSGLRFANGVALSRDRSFLVFCESTVARCQRYWLKGPRAGKHEIFVDLPGLPDNVRLNPRGRFWVAIHAKRGLFLDILATRPWLRKLLMKLPISTRLLYALILGAPHGMVVEVDEAGRITDVLEDELGTVVRAVSEVEERGGKLWMGSVIMPHMAIIDYIPPLAQ